MVTKRIKLLIVSIFVFDIITNGYELQAGISNHATITGIGEELKNGYLIGYQNLKTKNSDQETDVLSLSNPSKNIDLQKELNVFVNFDDIEYPIYIFPGDSLIVSCSKDGCTFYGNRQNEWNITSTLIKEGYPFYGLKQWNFGSVPYNKYLSSALVNRDKALGILEEFEQSTKLSEEFVQLLRRDIECAFIKAFIASHEKYGIRDKESELKIINFIGDYEVFFSTDTLRNSIIFSYALMDWSAFMARAQNNFSKPIKTNTYVEMASYDYGENYLQRLDMAKNMPERNRSDIIYSLLSFKFETGTWIGTEYIPYLNYFKSICQNHFLIEKLDALAGLAFILPDTVIVNKLNRTDDVLKTKLFDIKGNQTTWEELSGFNENKIVYIDFWASWCAPCIKELKESRELVKQLSKDGEVSFITITVDEDKNKWIKALNSLDMMNRYKNYQMSFESGLGKLLLPDKAVPKYIIIDKRGVVRTLNAPKLSSLSGKKIIESLLNGY